MTLSDSPCGRPLLPPHAWRPSAPARTGTPSAYYAYLTVFLSAALLLLLYAAAWPPPLRKTTASLWLWNVFRPVSTPPASGSLTSQIGAHLFAGLVLYRKGRPHTLSRGVMEIDSQAKRFRFHLRKGATFHDGTPITANDVAFFHPGGATAPSFPLHAQAVDKVVPVDDLTLDLETSIPQPALLKCFIPALVPVLPAHIYGDGTPSTPVRPFNPFQGCGVPVSPGSLEEGKTSSSGTLQGLFPSRQAASDRITFRVYWDQNEIPLYDHAGRSRSRLLPVG